MSKLPSDSEKNGGHDTPPQLACLSHHVNDGYYLANVRANRRLLLVGNALDEHFGTKPWLLLAGAIAGGAIAAILIKLQWRRVNKLFHNLAASEIHVVLPVEPIFNIGPCPLLIQ